jgi:hypothetical protein
MCDIFHVFYVFRFDRIDHAHFWMIYQRFSSTAVLNLKLVAVPIKPHSGRIRPVTRMTIGSLIDIITLSFFCESLTILLLEFDA